MISAIRVANEDRPVDDEPVRDVESGDKVLGATERTEEAASEPEALGAEQQRHGGGPGVADPIRDRPGREVLSEARGSLVFGAVALNIGVRVSEHHDDPARSGEAGEASGASAPVDIGGGGKVLGDLVGSGEHQQLDAPSVPGGGRAKGVSRETNEEFGIDRLSTEAPSHAPSSKGLRHVHPPTVADPAVGRYS